MTFDNRDADPEAGAQVFRDWGSVFVRTAEVLPSGNILLGGESGTSGAPLLAEIAPDGSVARQRLLTVSSWSWVRDQHATPDGGIILAGVALDGSSRSDVMLAKLDSSWSVEWSLYQGMSLRNETSSGIQPVSDGGWLAHGDAEGDGLLLRVDPTGAPSWQRTYEIPGFALTLSELEPLGGDRWLLAAMVRGSDRTLDQVLLAEIDADGVVTSAVLLDTPGQDRVTDVHVMPDGSAWISCTMSSPVDGAPVAAAIHRLPSGVIDSTFGFQGPSGLFARCSMTTPSGGLLIGCGIDSPPEGDQAVLLELDATGDLVRTSTIGGAEDDGFNALARTPAGVVAVGATQSFDGAGSPYVGWLVLLDDALQPPTNVTVRSALVTLPPIRSRVSVDPWSMTSTIGCLPLEVSPSGAVTPLLVRDHGVLTWEDGSFSGSDTFDVHRGDLRALAVGPGAHHRDGPGTARNR